MDKVQEHINNLQVMARQFSPIVGNVLTGAADIIEQQQREIERAQLQIKLLEQVTESTRFMIEENVRLRLAMKETTHKCGECNGVGAINLEPCWNCYGTGNINKEVSHD